MAFLTASNYHKIISDSDIKDIEVNENEIFKKPIYLLSKFDKQKIIALQSLFSDPLNFTNKYYKKLLKKEDTLSYIFEGGKSAYHIYSDCDRLTSNFTNYEIPLELRDKGSNEIKKFRTWFKQNMYLLEKPDVFNEKLRLSFGLKNQLKPVNYDNSGVNEIENLNLEELEKKINNLLNEAAQYYKKSEEKKQAVIRKFQRISFLGYTEKEIKNNDTGYSDEALKKFLRQYHEHFKIPIIQLLEQYHRIKLNPELNFEGTLLEQLGFKLCTNCANRSANSSK